MSLQSSLLLLAVAGLWHFLLYGACLGYVLGSIPFGLLLTKAAGLGDVRKIGSGNIGATNVLRTGRKGLAAATLLLDALKGTAAVVLADHWFGQAPAVLAGLFAFLGHLFPLWLKFRGGKGVATYIGVLLGLAPKAAALYGAVWLLVAWTTRYSSLAGLIASIAVPLGLLVWKQNELAAFASLMTLLLLWKHRSNIRRLAKGEEAKIGAKA